MQQFPCPFCGLRDETEFHFAAEGGKHRPEPAQDVSDKEWSDYLYAANATKGIAQEIWIHLTCGEFFMMSRDTMSREITNINTTKGQTR